MAKCLYDSKWWTCHVTEIAALDGSTYMMFVVCVSGSYTLWSPAMFMDRLQMAGGFGGSRNRIE